MRTGSGTYLVSTLVLFALFSISSSPLLASDSSGLFPGSAWFGHWEVLKARGRRRQAFSPLRGPPGCASLGGLDLKALVLPPRPVWALPAV